MTKDRGGALCDPRQRRLSNGFYWKSFRIVHRKNCDIFTRNCETFDRRSVELSGPAGWPWPQLGPSAGIHNSAEKCTQSHRKTGAKPYKGTGVHNYIGGWCTLTTQGLAYTYCNKTQGACVHKHIGAGWTEPHRRTSVHKYTVNWCIHSHAWGRVYTTTQGGRCINHTRGRCTQPLGGGADVHRHREQMYTTRQKVSQTLPHKGVRTYNT